MKKFILPFFLFLCAGSISAQKGVSSVGAFYSGQNHENWITKKFGGDCAHYGRGAGIKYQYYMSNHFRIEASMALYAPTEEEIHNYLGNGSEYKFDDNLPDEIIRNGRTYQRKYNWNNTSRQHYQSYGDYATSSKNAFQYLLNINMHYVIGNFRIVRPYVMMGLFAGGQACERETTREWWASSGTAHYVSESGYYWPSGSKADSAYYGTAISTSYYPSSDSFDEPAYSFEEYDETIGTETDNKLNFGVNAGFGVDIRLAPKWSLQVEFAAHAPFENFEGYGFFANIGAAYNF